MEPTLTTPTMHYWRVAPDPRLRPHVLCYFLALPLPGGGRAAPPLVEDELLLPDGHSEIVFQLGGAFERWPLNDAAERQVMQRGYVIGSRSHSVLTRDLGPVTVAGIKLDPRALRRLLGVPLTELRESTFTLDELGQRDLTELEEVLAGAVVSSAACVARSGDPALRDLAVREVSAVLDRYLLRQLPQLPPADAAVEQLLRHIRSSRGALPILEWVRARRIDARHLERRFAEAMGMTPKRYARVVRFKHGYHALLSGSIAQAEPCLQPVPAHRHLEGFYDQSHFNKEFRAFIGAAPSARLRATLRQATSITEHLLAGELASAC